MSKNIICIPYAFKPGARSGQNIYGDAYTVYLKNACVAAVSAKHYNPADEVCVATNMEIDKLPPEFTDVLTQKGVSIIFIPFDEFVFPNDYVWSLAFYKLCVLKYLSTMEYDNICYVDTDVYVQGSFAGIWAECQRNIMLYDVNYGLDSMEYIEICDQFRRYTGESKLLTHWGGEFVASSNELARTFCQELDKIYRQMIVTGFETNKGDEFLIDLAAEQMRSHIKNAGSYIYRFWTDPHYYLVSTCYKYNRVSVMHLPSEKNRGMVFLYDKYISKGIIPSDRKVWKICRVSGMPWLDRVKQLVKVLIRNV